MSDPRYQAGELLRQRTLRAARRARQTGNRIESAEIRRHLAADAVSRAVERFAEQRVSGLIGHMTNTLIAARRE